VSRLRADKGVRCIGLAKGCRIVLSIAPEIFPDEHDKMKMDVAICAAGVFYTEDGRRSWQPGNRGTRADFLPDRHPEIRQCVHKLLPAADGKRLNQQDHCDVHQSDSSRGWRDSARMIR
jgi:hypothetical protein